MIDTKLLRQKILDLAIRGKLVPQDPNDEPASELLKKIKAEKEALIKAGKLKRDKHESRIFQGDDKRYYEQVDGKTADITDELPFELPGGWAWCRMGMVSMINPRTHVDDCITVSFMPMTQLEGGYGSGYTLSEKKWGDVKTGFTHFQENDVVLAKITPCFQNRKSAIMRGLKNGYGAGTTELHVIRCFSSVLPEYVLWFVKNQTFISNAVSTIQGVVGQQRIDANFVKRDRPPTSSKHVFNRGNVLYIKLRTYLNKVLVADEDGYCTSEILPLDFGKYILPEFARCVLMSKMFLDYTARCGYGVKMPRLGTTDGQKALFPLPPLTEQKAIIARLNEFKIILSMM